MELIESAMSRSRTVILSLLVLLIGGFVAYNTIPKEAEPDIEIPVIYCALDNSYPDYMKPIDHSFVSADSASFVLPTHITFVASSSFDGANFAGAIGSVLIIDDVEMVYKEEE